MEAAKNVLNTVIDGIPERDGVNVGLRIYGHKGDNSEASKELSCESSELFVPLDGVDKDALRDSVDDLEPTGWTPLAESLERAGRDFNAEDDDTINVVVLLTDGVESCDGDPAQAAQELATGRARITTNVIGFGTTEEEQDTLEAIADSGEGELFGAQNAAELSDALFSVLAEDIPDIATPEPTEEAREESDDAGTRDNPVSFGESAEVGDYTLTVVDVMSDATDIVLAENQFNEPPGEGRQYFIATVDVTYNGESSGTPFAELNFQAVGDSAVSYTTFDNMCGVVPNGLFDTASELFPNGSVEINVCWSVSSEDVESLLLYVESFLDFNSDPVFYSLDPE